MYVPAASLTTLLLFFFAAIVTSSQGIPDDPNHLPKMIGGQPPSNNRVDSMQVAGKVILDGLRQDQPRPTIFVAVYSYGRLVVRRRVSDNGSYSVSDVPREGSTLVVEIDDNEVASSQIIPSPAMVTYQDFNVSWPPLTGTKPKTGVINALAYTRTGKNQDRFDHAIADIGQGKTDTAIKALKAILDEDPGDYYCWTQLGNAYFLKKEYKSAENAYLRAIGLRASYTLASVNLGKLFISQNNFDAAIEALTPAVTADPGSADAQQFLGEAYLGIKKGSKAVGYLNEALRLAPIEKAEIHLRLAALYHGAGLKSLASAEYQRFLTKNPKYEKRSELEKYIRENPPTQ